MMIADALPDPHSFVAMGWVITVLLGISGGYLMLLKIAVARKELAAGPIPSGLQPQPFITQLADVFVKEPILELKIAEVKKEISEVEVRIEKKLLHNEAVFRERFLKIDNDLEGISKEALNGRTIATEQFQKIEGRLGKIDGVLEHANAAAVRTDQAVRNLIDDLPQKIASALSLSNRNLKR